LADERADLVIWPGKAETKLLNEQAKAERRNRQRGA
jgi:hypothetical protein